MTQLSLFTPGSAQQLRDKGIRKAKATAEKYDPSWGPAALALLKMFMAEHKGGSFLTEQVREYAESRGLDAPASKRAWGAVILAARRQGLIRFSGYGVTSNPKCHCTPAATWIKA